MARHIDRETMLGFIDEARGYLPRIRAGLERVTAGEHPVDALEEPHRLIHSIKGASSMIGESVLGHIAFFAEEALERIGAGQLDLDPPTAAALEVTLGSIERYLDGLQAGSVDRRPLLEPVVRHYRRLDGRDEAGDAAAINALLPAEPVTGAPIATEATAPPPSPPVEEVDEIDEVDVFPELLDAFAQESEDHLQHLSEGLRSLERDPANDKELQSILRRLHTLKGAAGMVGFAQVSRLAHRMEDLVERLNAGSLTLTAPIFELLFEGTDVLTDLTTGAIEPGEHPAVTTPLYARFDALLGRSTPAADALAPTEPLPPLGEEPSFDLRPPSEAATPREPARTGKPAAQPTSDQIVRVPIERLDELVRLVSELVVNRSTFEQHFRRYSREVGELRLTMDRLRGVTGRIEAEFETMALPSGGMSLSHQPHALAVVGGTPLVSNPHGFDDLELDRYSESHLLSRELSETSADIMTIGGELSNEVGDFDSFLNGLGRLTGEIQDKLMQLRMVPFASLATRLHRTVRVTAAKQGKQVDLVIDGGHTDLDKGVLETIADPLLHLLRNSVDHGIEPAALRHAIGKSERGQIRINVFHQGTNVVIEVHDDGAGFEPEALRAAAVRAGYVSEADAAELTDQALQSFIFLPGFSTAGELSEVSGRGVGLDVVKTSVASIKGTVSVASGPESGTCFTIRLPMTLAIVRVLLVRAGAQRIAVPLAAVTKIVRRQREDLESLGNEPVLRIDQRVFPTLFLSEVLGQSAGIEEGPQRRLPVLVLDLGDQQVALVVDQILEAREVVVKSLGNLLKRVAGISGATLMGDGSVVLILNPDDLAPQRQSQATTPSRMLEPSADLRPRRLDIMIVDDSVSVRRLLSNLVKMAGWNPVTARDGLDALGKIQQRPTPPDLVLLDLEMPRMDGYELTSTLRAEEAYRSIPIVILTSRPGEKHRRRAFDLGATEYLVKPYNDETLVSVIRRLTRGTGDVAAS